MGFEIIGGVGEMERTVIFVDLFAELVEMFRIQFDAGGAGMAATGDDGALGVAEGVGEVKVAKAAAGAFVEVRGGRGEGEGGFMVLFNEAAGDEAKDTFVPGASFDNDGVVADAAGEDFLDGKILFIFTFFVQLF